MKFKVSEEVFNQLDDLCFGVVVAKGIDNTKSIGKIDMLLEKNIERVEKYFENKKVKESEEILPYREAFKSLNINPNKFMSSIEAMTSRVAKNKKLPHINSIVDLGNAISLKYLVPLGAHDIDDKADDICVRFSKEGDEFIPFGSEELEHIDNNEIIYAIGNSVKTRRWIWRQGEIGKITNNTKNIFIPIDGFKTKNIDKVISARDEIASLLKEIFDCEVEVGLVDKNNKEMEF